MNRHFAGGAALTLTRSPRRGARNRVDCSERSFARPRAEGAPSAPGEGGPCGAIEAGGHAELMPAWCCDDPDGDDCFGRARIFPHCADGAPSPGGEGRGALPLN